MNRGIFDNERDKIWRLEVEGELLPEEITELFDGADRSVKDTARGLILFYLPGPEFDKRYKQNPKPIDDYFDRTDTREDWNDKNPLDFSNDGDDDV
jgi:hypothetical protein